MSIFTVNTVEIYYHIDIFQYHTNGMDYGYDYFI